MWAVQDGCEATVSSSLADRRIPQQDPFLALAAERDGGLGSAAGPRHGHHDALAPPLVEHGVAGNQVRGLAEGRGRRPEGAGRALLLDGSDELLRDLAQEPRRWIVVGTAEQRTAPRVGEVQALAGARDSHVREPALLLQLARVGHGP